MTARRRQARPRLRLRRLRLRRFALALGLGLRLSLGLLWLGGAAAGCHSERASLQTCTEILDHLIELELRERGYRDPELARRKKRELATRFAPDLERCRGRLVRHDALECIARAKNTEEIGHRCLR